MVIKLGDKVKDKITGFTGILVGRTEWLNGCIRFGVQSEKLNKDGEPIEPEWFDEERVELVGKKKRRVVRPEPEPEPRGGPMPDPTYT